MAKIYPDESGRATELSYMDLCYMLLEDIDTNLCIPKDEREDAKETLASLMDILIPYSG